MTYWAINSLNEWITDIQSYNNKIWNNFSNKKNEITKSITHPRDVDKNGNKIKTTITVEKKHFPNKFLFEEIFHNSFQWSKSELYKLLSYYLGKDYERTDPIRCIYCLAIYSKYHKHRKNTLVQNIKPISNYNHSFVHQAIKNVLQEQQSFGLWKKYLPVLAIPSNDGNVYPFAVSTLAELIAITDACGDLFEPFVSGIKDVVNWINRNEKENYGYNQKKDPNTFLGNYSGWRSSHSSNPHGNPEAWSTALVFDSVYMMKKKVENEITNEIVLFYKGKNPEKLSLENIRKPRNNLFKIEFEKQNIDFPNMIDQMFVSPVLQSTNSATSSIIYGPPGTGKSSIVKFIAHSKHWNFIRIDTSTLLKYGMDNAADTINAVFTHLGKLKKTVILFDEIDEFLRERKEETAFNNRVLTNMMLTRLNDLKENKDIIYIIATNNFDELDSAIIRHGRFDSRIYLGFVKEEIEELCIGLHDTIKKEIMNLKHKKISKYSDATLKDFISYCINNGKEIGSTNTIDNIVNDFKKDFLDRTT